MANEIADFGRFKVMQADSGHVWTSPGDVVAVLPYDDESFYLALQNRTPVGHDVLGLCAGGIEEGEDPSEAAERELKEEFGMDCGKLEYVDTFFSSEGITDERCVLFLATDLTRGEPTDPGEGVRVVRAPLEKLNAYARLAQTSKAKIALMRLALRNAERSEGTGS